MMKLFIASLILVFSTPVLRAQKSEELIPEQAVSVFSVNNVNLLQRISLDDLVKYEFMEELQQELFDGSTSGKTLKDSGIDFDQKLNIFFGRGERFELGGVSFGVKDRAQLFEVFDDFQAIESPYPGVDFYASYFNTIAIKGNAAVLFRVSPNMELVNETADSIWFSRGYGYPWEWQNESSLDEILRQLEEEESWDEEVIAPEQPVEFFEDMETEENTVNPSLEEELPEAGDDPAQKTYYELIDSVQVALQQQFMLEVSEALFLHNRNLMKRSTEFTALMTHTAEGTFFLDNSMGFEKGTSFNRLRYQFPGLYEDMVDLYQGNVLLGDLVIEDQAIVLKLKAKYGTRLGEVYEGMTAAKFDKQILKYIHKDHNAFFTLRMNTRQAYEDLFALFHPMLSKEAEQSRRISEQLMSLELWNELINKDAAFKAVKGSAFITYNGISKVKTRKYVFEYDEETFEYTEREVEAEEDMPLFTFGISTENPNVATIVLNHLERTESECHKENDVWVFDKAILRAAPLYVFVRNGLILYTNDAKLALQHPDGYGAEALEKNLAKAAQSSGFLYGYADLGKAIEGLPRELFTDRENEMLDVIRGKSGHVQFTSTATSAQSTDFKLHYAYEGDSDSSGTYILDLINSLYVISK
jgi:hypothetical protein